GGERRGHRSPAPRGGRAGPRPRRGSGVGPAGEREGGRDERMTEQKVIVISDREPGLPYSKGLRASQLMVTGLSPYRAYQVAEQVEERLRERGASSVTSKDLDQLTSDVLTDVAGERYARNFRRWLEIGRLDVPLVVLIGGATGV